MTYKELHDEIVHLAFDKTPDPDLNFNFVEGINRAVYQVNQIRPALGVAQILHHPVAPEAFYPELTVLDEKRTYPANGARSLWAEAAGKGIARMYGEDEEILSSVSWDSTEFTVLNIALAENTASVSFEQVGRGACVRNICFYEKAYEDGKAPGYTAGARRYDMNDIVPDFQKAFGLPYTQHGSNVIFLENARITGSKLYIDTCADEVIFVRYYKKMPRILGNEDEMESDIPLDADLLPLLAPAAAQWLYLYQDEKLSAYYSQLYDGMVAQIDRSRHETMRAVSINHWG